MSCRKVYKCNICLKEKEPIQLIGLKFEGNYTFALDYATATDGSHICISCYDQIKNNPVKKGVLDDAAR